MKERRSHAAPIFAAIALLLPLLYVGTYLALVDPVTDKRGAALASALGENVRVDDYRLGGRLAMAAYWPLEQLDRKFRPQRWAQVQRIEYIEDLDMVIMTGPPPKSGADTRVDDNPPIRTDMLRALQTQSKRPQNAVNTPTPEDPLGALEVQDKPVAGARQNSP